ncbi:MAG TPA: PD-(D/E)XK nuclease family protein [Gemmatimonadaceae bacterium]|nr:PD-(D/E)XK nuclease family protein [Gemmatimonadaceae bacterium]
MIVDRSVLLPVAVGAAAVGLLCAALLWWLRRTTGLPAASGSAPAVVASDTGAAASTLLRDPALGVRGRPDYLVEEPVTAGAPLLVPIEVKPSRRSARLYESDEVQLGAYLLALRATHPERAAGHGYVRYAARGFRVELTAALERRVRAIVAAVRAGRSAAVVHRSHDVPARCAACPVRERCDERLA